MSVVVFQLEHSPYCIPITQALTALGVDFETRNVSPSDRGEIIRQSNGLYYQVPLLTDDEKIVYESGSDTLDIARYVDETYRAGRLFPAALEGLQRIVIPYIEDQVEGTTFKLIDPFYIESIPDLVERTMLIRHKERKFGRGCVASWMRDHEQLLAQAESLLEPFDLMLRESPFLFGGAPVFADFALYGIIGNFTYRGHHAIPPSLTALAEWTTRLREFRY